MLPEVACVAVFHNGKILMGRRRDSGAWTQPGGHLENEESPIEGAVREVREESGIDLEPHTLKHLATEVVTKPDGKKIKVHAFRAVVHKAPTSIKEDPDAEVHRWHWLSMETLHSPKVWDELHVKPEKNVVLKGLGLVEQKTAALKAPKHPDDWYPKEQIGKGMKVEKEHSNDPTIRATITKNHLDERRDYYNNELFKSDLEKKAMAQSTSKIKQIMAQLIKDAQKQVFVKKGSDTSGFWAGFEKQAKLSIKDIEDHLGVYMANKQDHDTAQKGIEDATANSVAIRHPWLTGIPTLGMWPAIAHSSAIEDIASKVMRESPTLRGAVHQAREIAHQREMDLMPKHIEERKAESHEQMMSTATTAALLGMSAYLNSKEKEKTASISGAVLGGGLGHALGQSSHFVRGGVMESVLPIAGALAGSRAGDILRNLARKSNDEQRAVWEKHRAGLAAENAKKSEAPQEKTAFGKFEAALDTPEKKEKYKKLMNRSVVTNAGLLGVGSGIGAALGHHLGAALGHHLVGGKGALAHGLGTDALAHGLGTGALMGGAALAGGAVGSHFKKKKSLAEGKVTGYGFDSDVARFKKKLEEK